jgi:hypothetical protein
MSIFTLSIINIVLLVGLVVVGVINHAKRKAL